MTTIINAVSGSGLTQTADGSGIVKLQSNGVTTNALAWVNWNGSTAAIRASYNVSSVTRTTTGTYTVNIANALLDANSATLAIAGGQNRFASAYPASTTTVAVTTATNAGALTDETYISVAIFGN